MICYEDVFENTVHLLDVTTSDEVGEYPYMQCERPMGAMTIAPDSLRKTSKTVTCLRCIVALLACALLAACSSRNNPKAACGGRRAETLGGVVVIGCR